MGIHHRTLALLFLLLTACKPTNSEKARDLILHYGDHHYKQYQPLEFDEPRPYTKRFENTPVYISYSKQQKTLQLQHDSLTKLIAQHNKPAYLLQADQVKRNLYAVDSALNQARLNYKAAPGQWRVTHSYNQKTDMGTLVRSTTVFIIDEDIKRVVETLDH